MEQRISAFQQAVKVLPMQLRAAALALPAQEQGRAEEIRLRVGQPMTVVFPEEERSIGAIVIQTRQLEQLLEIASCASVHSVLPQLQEGFLTIEGGHRIGLCGTAVLEGEKIRILRNLSSAAIRIARQFPGVSREVVSKIFEDGQLQSTLILAPPGAGKTSLLRDLIRTISDGDAGPPLRVGVVDQRGELGAVFQGIPQLGLGSHTDLLDGCPKAQGLMMLLRSMNPQVLAVDEVTAPEDVQALTSAVGCGVALLATIHGNGREDLRRRELYRMLMSERMFTRLVTIHGRGENRQYRVEVLQ